MVGEQVDELIQPVREQHLDGPAHGGVGPLADHEQLDLVGDVADERLPEGVGQLRRRRARDDELLGLEDAETSAHRSLGQQLREDAIPERPSDDRRGTDDAGRRVGQAVEPRFEHLGDRRGEALGGFEVRADPPVALDEAAGALELADELLDEERVAPRARQDAVGERGVDGELDHGFDQLATTRVVERREVDALRRPRRRPLDPARREEQTRQRGGIADELVEHVEARVIDPVEILGRDDERTAGDRGLEDRSQEPDEQGPLALRVDRRTCRVADDLEHDRRDARIDHGRVPLQPCLERGCRRGLVVRGVDAERATDEVRDERVRGRLFVRGAARRHAVDLRGEGVPEFRDEA